MGDLHIRDTKDSDREALRDVTIAAFQEYAPQMPAHWEDYRARILTTLENIGEAEQIIAEKKGEIVGTVLLYPAGAIFYSPTRPAVTLTWPEIRLLAVAPPARGLGIGAALIRECILRARRSGASAITLHTSDIMQTAMRMYERIGFTHAPELDFHPSPDLTIKGYYLSLEKSGLAGPI